MDNVNVPKPEKKIINPTETSPLVYYRTQPQNNTTKKTRNCFKILIAFTMIGGFFCALGAFLAIIPPGWGTVGGLIKVVIGYALTAFWGPIFIISLIGSIFYCIVSEIIAERR